MDKLKVVDAAWHGMKGAWGMAKDQLTGDSADDAYDPKLSPLQAFTNSSKLTANQSVDHSLPMRMRVGGQRPSVLSRRGAEVPHASSTRRYKCCVCSMCGCLLEWGICFGRRGGDGPCCFDCCWCPCCP